MEETITKYIAIDSLNDLKEFIGEATKLRTKTWAIKNGSVVNCTSLLGLISIDTSSGFWVEYSPTETEFENYISQFKAEAPEEEF